jgi:hypothetical protein
MWVKSAPTPGTGPNKRRGRWHKIRPGGGLMTECGREIPDHWDEPCEPPERLPEGDQICGGCSNLGGGWQGPLRRNSSVRILQRITQTRARAMISKTALELGKLTDIMTGIWQIAGT